MRLAAFELSQLTVVGIDKGILVWISDANTISQPNFTKEIS